MRSAVSLLNPETRVSLPIVGATDGDDEVWNAGLESLLGVHEATLFLGVGIGAARSSTSGNALVRFDRGT